MSVTRRTFLQTAAAMAGPAAGAGGDRPNLLWLVWEDTGPHLHCYGDEYSVTPNFDRLARRGCVFTNAWASAPVCAPARTAMISGLCPTSTGTEHMRSITRLPQGWKMFPGYLRDAGYYCVNNGKEDYNLEVPAGTWDVSWDLSTALAAGKVPRTPSPDGNGFAIPPIDPANGHWRDRKPGQPFLAVFNDYQSHESQIFRSAINKNLRHDPARAPLAAYQADTPEMRRDWAQYHDLLSMVDGRHQARLDELEKDGLAENTIIVVTSDHGCGLARHKRMPYDSGLHVPMILYFPEKYRHLAPKDYRAGGRSERLIGTIDLAPTMLSLAGIRPPEFYHGSSFGGHFAAAPRSYLHGMRGRMDERYDLIRSTRDKRYVYMRNYNPHKIYGQHLNYSWQLPSTPVWERKYREGQLKAPQTLFWETKPAEELYDLASDPSEVVNLAAQAQHRGTLDRFRRAHHEYELHVRDVGFLPEGEIHSRATGSTPYEMGHDNGKYPLERILAAADHASSGAPLADSETEAALKDSDSAVRYWAVMGILIRGAAVLNRWRANLETALKDDSPYVRIAAAETLGRYGSDEEATTALTMLVELADSVKHGTYVALHALNAIDAIGNRARPFKEKIAGLPTVDPKSPSRVNREYATNLVKWLGTKL